MKLAIITGGSRGLGKALVDLHAKHGWAVREFSRSGTSEHHIPCDLSQFEDSATIISNTFRQLSAQDWREVRLINNAGLLDPVGPLRFHAPEQWQTNIQVNIYSYIVATGLFMKNFNAIDTKYCLANISSGASVKAYYGWSLYCASKAAIEAFTRSVALEQSYRNNPVVAVIIVPGVIETAMQDLIRRQDSEHFKDVDRFIRLKRQGKLQSPEEVAEGVYAIMNGTLVGGEKYYVKDYLS